MIALRLLLQEEYSGNEETLVITKNVITQTTKNVKASKTTTKPPKFPYIIKHNHNQF